MTLARVNGICIEKLDYLLELAVLSHDESLFSVDDSIKKDVIVQLIDDTLILQYAISNQINVSNEEVEESYLNTLLELNTRFDFSDFLVDNNINENVFMRRIKNHLIIHKFLKEFYKKDIHIEEQSLRNIYNENQECFETEETVHVYHILIEHFNENAEEEIRRIRTKINTTDDFFYAVENCSECPTGCQSGDLGYHIKGELIPELDEVIFKLKLNQVSNPIRSEYGWHLVLVTDKRDKKKSCFEDIKNALKEQMLEMEIELKIVQLLRELKEQSEIIVYVDL